MRFFHGEVLQRFAEEHHKGNLCAFHKFSGKDRADQCEHHKNTGCDGACAPDSFQCVIADKAAADGERDQRCRKGQRQSEYLVDENGEEDQQ